MAKRTTHTRIKKKLYKELKTSFPNVKMPELLDVMYKTSALRPEIWLRKPNKTLNEILKKKQKKKKIK